MPWACVQDTTWVCHAGCVVAARAERPQVDMLGDQMWLWRTNGANMVASCRAIGSRGGSNAVWVCAGVWKRRVANIFLRKRFTFYIVRSRKLFSHAKHRLRWVSRCFQITRVAGRCIKPRGIYRLAIQKVAARRFNSKRGVVTTCLMRYGRSRQLYSFS